MNKFSKNMMVALTAMLLSFPMMFSIPAAAQNIMLPPGFAVERAAFGAIHARPGKDIVEAYATLPDGTVYDVQFGPCSIKWATNESFYIIIAQDIGIFVTPVRILNGFLNQSNQNFSRAVSMTIESGQLCDVVDIWKV